MGRRNKDERNEQEVWLRDDIENLLNGMNGDYESARKALEKTSEGRAYLAGRKDHSKAMRRALGIDD